MHERHPSMPAASYGYPVPPDTGMSGTGLVADDLYLLAHDDRTGKPLLHPRPLGIGLAGGLLAELILADWADLRLSFHHAVLDEKGIPAYLAASAPDTRRI